MSVAVGLAKDFVFEALSQAAPVGSHQPLYFNWNQSESFVG